jgi:hypothetical protein
MRAGSDRQTDTYCRRQGEGKASRARARGRATLLLPLGKTRGEKRQSMGRARERAECSADWAGGARYLSLLCFMKLGPCLRNSVVSPKSGHPIVPGGRPRRRLYRSSFHRSSRLLASTTPSTASRSNSSAISCVSLSLSCVCCFQQDERGEGKSGGGGAPTPQLRAPQSKEEGCALVAVVLGAEHPFI